ncbi:transcriptional regulator [Lojkania enalia]|uniref:Transcriptional regulator n=1 Tax=Lojkania enalia TaxID=147567 RepID=A0A9P4KFD8_9PLEO|nr:transcriptional regulator [Didymosphaeria enalia]
MSQFKIAVILYPGADILDFSGPIEIFNTSVPIGTTPSFSTTTFAAHTPLKGEAAALVYIPDKSLQDLETSLGDYDILLVPGAHPKTIEDLVAGEEGKRICRLIGRFAGLGGRNGGTRIVMSVCTGALLLGAAGILANRTVTTHHVAYDMLKQICDQAAGGESGTNVQRGKRWVDAGVTGQGVRILNAGGVTSGIDLSLFVVEELTGRENAQQVASIVEFERRGVDDGWAG